MHIAAQSNAVSLVQTLLDIGEGYDTLNHIGRDFLQCAAAAGAADVLKAVYPMVSPEKFLIKDNNKRNLYHIAAINNQYNVITTLFSLGLKNFNEKDKTGKTPLHYAALLEYEAVSEFLANNCEKIEVDDVGMNPLHYAAKSGNVSVVSTLLKTGKFDINAKEGRGKTVVYVACEGGSLSTVKFLVENHADVNIVPEDGTSLATVAVMNNDMRILEYLTTIEDYDITAPDKKEWTPVHYASQLGFVEVLELFNEKYPDSIFKANAQGRAPLSVAAVWGKLESLAYFMKIDDMDFCIPDNFGNTPLHLAIMNNHTGFAKELLRTKDADINAQNDDGETPLILAVRRWNIDLIEELVDSGICKLNLFDKFGKTALIYAAAEGQVKVVQYLIAQPGIDCKITDDKGWGPQHYAATLRTYDVTKVLVDSEKFNFNYITKKGNLPIDLAKKSESDENVQYLNRIFQYDQPRRRSTNRSPHTFLSFMKPAQREAPPAVEKVEVKEPISDSDEQYEEESYSDDFAENEEIAKQSDDYSQYEEEEDM